MSWPSACQFGWLLARARFIRAATRPEFAQHLFLRVTEIASAEEVTAVCIHRGLEVRAGQSRLGKQDSTSAFPHALAAAVGEVHDSRGSPAASRSVDPDQRCNQELPGRQDAMKCVIGGDHSRDEADQSS
jgi:hypothetical protein